MHAWPFTAWYSDRPPPRRAPVADVKQDSKPYRFRPRFLGVAFLSLSIGVILIACSFTLTPDRMSSVFAFATGAAGLFFGFAYLRSPVWRLAVDVREEDLVVWNGLEERLRLPWSEIKQVVVDPDHKTCYVDGGKPELSLLVPGPGAAASYDIKDKDRLISEILARVPAELVHASTDPCITAPKD